MVIVIPVIHPKGKAGQICDRNIAEPGFSDLRHVCVQSVSELCLGEGKSALNVFGEVLLLGSKVGQDPALDGKDRGCDLPGRAGDKAAGQLIFGKGFISGQRMFRGADAGDGDRTKFFEIKRGLFLSFFCAKSRVKFLVFYQSEKGRKGIDADRGA